MIRAFFTDGWVWLVGASAVLAYALSGLIDLGVYR